MSNTPEERIQHRRARRWKRRARIAAPFLCLPLLIGMLMLSVDLIEYRPEEPREKLSKRPIVRPSSSRMRDARLQSAVSSASVVDPELTRPPEADPTATDSIALDMGLPAPETLRPPSRPYALGRP